MSDHSILAPSATPAIDRLALGVVDPRGAQPAQGFSMDCYCVVEE